MGEYTFPIEQECFGTTPPVPGDLNPLGQFTLVVIPVIPMAWLLSVTLIPLLGNSLQSLFQAFIQVVNLALYGFPADQKLSQPSIFGVNLAEDARNGLRQYLYGVHGTILGAVVGIGIAVGILFVRMITNSIKMFAFSYLQTLDYVVDKSDVINYQPELRLTGLNYGLGWLGLGLGIGFGLATWPAILLARTLINSAKSFSYYWQLTVDQALLEGD